MPFSTITTTPEELAALSQAFDEAWAAISEQEPVEASAQPAERERLAYLMIGLFRSGTNDLVGTAVKEFKQSGLSLMDRSADAAHRGEPTKA